MHLRRVERTTGKPRGQARTCLKLSRPARKHYFSFFVRRGIDPVAFVKAKPCVYHAPALRLRLLFTH